jgi:amino acid transporter
VFSKVNIWLIVSDHVNTFRSYATSRIWPGDILLFLLAPAAAALFLVFGLQFRLDVPAINVLITSLSVFSALLFNLLLLIYDILRKERGDQDQSKQRRQFLGQISSNISFSILVAVIASPWFCSSSRWIFLLTDTPTTVIHFLVINFILTVLMILKRVHI